MHAQTQRERDREVSFQGEKPVSEKNNEKHPLWRTLTVRKNSAALLTKRDLSSGVSVPPTTLWYFHLAVSRGKAWEASIHLRKWVMKASFISEIKGIGLLSTSHTTALK